jgi:hypothetical protein
MRAPPTPDTARRTRAVLVSSRRAETATGPRGGPQGGTACLAAHPSPRQGGTRAARRPARGHPRRGRTHAEADHRRNNRPATSRGQQRSIRGTPDRPGSQSEPHSRPFQRVPKLMTQRLPPRPKSSTSPRWPQGRYGVAARWRKRHPCPHRSDEQCGQDEGDGGSAGPSARLPNRGTGTERLS